MNLLRSACALAAVFAISGASAQAIFRRSDAPMLGIQQTVLPWVMRYQGFLVDAARLKDALDSAPLEDVQRFSKFRVIALPNPDGGIEQFKVAESPILSQELASQIPVKTYKVMGIDDVYASGRIDLGPNGFHAFIQSPGRSFIIDPVALGRQDLVVVYYRRDSHVPPNFMCLTLGDPTQPSRGGAYLPGNTLKTYRLAMNATGEYTAFYGSQAAAANGVVTSVNRVNQVYEAEVAVRLKLVRNMCYSTFGIPFTNNDVNAMLNENQAICDLTPGNAGYDIGHVFSTGGGGRADIGGVGVAGRKAKGVTGQPSPIGDPFDIDYVAHEMGHQFNGNHTFANCTGLAGPVPYEMFSGSTIMAYAKLCAVNVQPNSDAYFHLISLLELTPFRDGTSAGNAEANGNLIPVASAGADYNVPAGTPIKLTGSGTDGNGDPLTYCWELWEQGNNATGATHRSRTGTSSPFRFVPPLTNVINSTADQFDPLLQARTARWRVTARDNRAGGGGYGWDEMIMTVTGAPFSVTSPNTAVVWPAGSTQTVTWNVGGSGATQNVRILLSGNGGTSYGSGMATVVLDTTSNNGSATVTVPNLPTTRARIIIEGVNNIFYDMSDVNITIPIVPVCDTRISPDEDVNWDSTHSIVVYHEQGNVQRGLMQFNLSTIPAGAAITAATLRLTERDTGYTSQGLPTYAFRVTRPWVEILATGIRADSTTLWTFSGGDFVGTTGIQDTAPYATAYDTGTAPLLEMDLKSLVRAWVEDGLPNYGFMLKAPVGNHLHFYSREFDLPLSPVLTIEYTDGFSLAMNKYSVAGQNSVLGIITMTEKEPQNTVFTTYDNSSLVTTPPSVTVLAGQLSRNFQITTTAITSTVVTTIYAKLGSLVRSKTLTLMPLIPTAMVFTPSQVTGGNPTSCRVVINGVAGPGGRVIAIFDNSAYATAPSTVTVPSGATDVTFTIMTLPVTSIKYVTVTARVSAGVKTGTFRINP